MKKIVFIISLFLLTTGYLLYEWISGLPPVLPDYNEIEVTIANGEKLFWGKGTCHVCHRIGERGYALRGPNLGESKDGPVLPLRAEQRASALQLTSGLEYLTRSVAEPGSYLVPGYKNEMPEAYKPPIGLSPSEMKSIILYLAALSGDSTTEEIELPDTALNWYRSGAEQKVAEITGDVESGLDLFFDLQGAAACAACHVGIDAEGYPAGDTSGPDLSAIGAIRTPEYILQKIVNPDSNQVSGYDRVLIETTEGSLLLGKLVSDRGDSLVLRNAFGEHALIAKRNVASTTAQNASSMPGNYDELLTSEQLHDLVAYLVSLTGHRL